MIFYNSSALSIQFSVDPSNLLKCDEYLIIENLCQARKAISLVVSVKKTISLTQDGITKGTIVKYIMLFQAEKYFSMNH